MKRDRGPGFRISDFESNRIIGQLQFEGARTIMNRDLAPVNGSVRSVHTYLNMQVPQMDGYLMSVKVAPKGFSSIQAAERYSCYDMSGCPGFVLLGTVRRFN